MLTILQSLHRGREVARSRMWMASLRGSRSWAPSEGDTTDGASDVYDLNMKYTIELCGGAYD